MIQTNYCVRVKFNEDDNANQQQEIINRLKNWIEEIIHSNISTHTNNMVYYKHKNPIN